MKSLTMKSLLYTSKLVSHLHDCALPTENLSSVNCGPRPDVLEVVCVRIDAVSMADVVRVIGSIARGVLELLARS
jgi:hypothetical protein